MRTLIIDDERLARKELISLLEVHPQIEIIGEATDAEDALEKINQLDPQLIFLDIQMPGKNGFELLEQLESAPMVIFTTAYDEFAIKAFEYNALDYLLKPIQPNRLADSLQKLIVESRPKIDIPLQKDRKLNLEDKVFVKDGEKCWFVQLEDVRLFESDGNYIKIHFEKFKPMIHKSLNALEERLDERYFFRASRKHIVNLSWVHKIEPWFNGGLMVELRGGDKVEVSRRQATRFKDIMSL